MIHIGNLEQLQLPTLLERIQAHRKTGKVLVIYDGVQEEIYVDQGQVVAVSSPDDKEPLLRRLARSGVVSLSILQHLPTNIGQILSQSQGQKRYSDVQIAKALLELGVVSHKQLANWVQQENTKALERLLSRSNGQIYFEEGVQLPSDHLYLFLETLASRSRAPYDTTPIRSNEEGETSLVSVTPAPTINAVTPSGFVRWPGTIGRTLAIPAVQATQVVIQRTASAIRPFLPIDDTLTERVPTPPKPNPLFKWETLLIIAVLLIAGLAHGINMFHYPYYYDDEGTYMAQAWAVINEGKLAPYTYIYDHAPVGWLQIALWTILTGGFHVFGMVDNSGRAFMLLIQICSTFLLYRITRTISRSVIIAVVVSLLFALSPYGLYYHRRVLLDNICTVWMLLSISLILSKRLTLSKVWLSAAALATSILSKEVSVFLIPAMVYLVYYRTNKVHRRLATIGWITLLFILVSFYPLMAILKNELFPSGTLLGGNAPHVSLIGTLLYQASRGKDSGLLNGHSAFWQMFVSWMRDDPTLVVGGSIAAVISAIVIKWHRLVGIMGIMALSLWFFLGRGGEIIGFYLVPLLPLLALNVGLFLWLISKSLAALSAKVSVNRNILGRSVQSVLIVLCLVGMLAGYTSPNPRLQADPLAFWNSSPTTGEQEAVTWVKEHISANSRILIDDFMWTDLHDTGNFLHNYQFAYYYWKVYADPANGVFHNNWHNVDYIVTTIDMFYDAHGSNMSIVENALNHSTILAKFDTGWPIEILKVNK